MRESGIGLSIKAQMKMMAVTTLATSFTWHRELGFWMTTLRCGWCCHHGLNSPSLFSVLVRSDHNEWLVRINLPFKLISIGFELGRLRLVYLLLWWQKEEGRHNKEDVQFHLRTLVAALWTHVLNLFDECLPVWSSIWIFVLVWN
jgi:hypothetical protein